MSGYDMPTPRRYPRYLDRAGRALSLMEWAVMFEDNRYRFLAFTQVSEGIVVSTIWEGMSHNLFGGRDVFETAVFVELDEPRMVHGVKITRERAEEGGRATTEELALQVHEETVNSLLSDMGRTEPEQKTFLPQNPATDAWYAAVRITAANLECAARTPPGPLPTVTLPQEGPPTTDVPGDEALEHRTTGSDSSPEAGNGHLS